MWKRFSENPTATATAVSVLSFLTGAGSTYLFVSHRLEQKYSDEMKKEIKNAEDYYSRLFKRGEYEDPVELEATSTRLEEDAEKAYNEYAGRVSSVPEDEPAETEEDLEESRVVNIFDSPGIPDPSIWAEDRENQRPYIIDHDEYMSGDSDYSQSTLTFFVEDGVLVDEKDMPVADNSRDLDKFVGEDNMTRFGHGSGDPNVVYIRNDVLEADYEVIKSARSYSQDVLGLKHSADHRPRRKMRVTDE